MSELTSIIIEFKNQQSLTFVREYVAMKLSNMIPGSTSAFVSSRGECEKDGFDMYQLEPPIDDYGGACFFAVDYFYRSTNNLDKIKYFDLAAFNNPAEYALSDRLDSFQKQFNESFLKRVLVLFDNPYNDEETFFFLEKGQLNNFRILYRREL